MAVKILNLRRALIALILLGITFIFVGIGFATIWKPSSVMRVSTPGKLSAPYVVSGKNLLESTARNVTIRVIGEKDQQVHLAVGTTADVLDWVENREYELLSDFASAEVFTVKKHEAKESPSPVKMNEEKTASENSPVNPDPENPPADPQIQHPASGTPAPVAGNPVASDMWTALTEGSGEAQIRWTLRGDRWSLLAASDGEKPAPKVELEWKIDPVNPWPVVFSVLGILIAAGAAIVLLLHEITERRSAQKRLESREKQRARRATEEVAAANDPSNTSVTTTLSRREIRATAQQEQERKEKGSQK